MSIDTPLSSPPCQRSLRAVWHPCTQMQPLHGGALPPLPAVAGKDPDLLLDDTDACCAARAMLDLFAASLG